MTTRSASLTRSPLDWQGCTAPGDDWRRSRIERKTGRNRARSIETTNQLCRRGYAVARGRAATNGHGQFRHALQLAGGPEAVQHDLGLLLDSTNLLGGVCQQVDVKRWM